MIRAKPRDPLLDLKTPSLSQNLTFAKKNYRNHAAVYYTRLLTLEK